ncbi:MULTISPECIES: PQQ-binding-like beta-propeller repeat protein [Streptomyces]|uniref:PQQ-binding-like beta-propeller repeat protein n=1 Tax=Streptomyces koelreuteriae TaxID=2838015 RepID=A0ABX8FS50_9ACTN|nr:MULTISPECIES: PQQ-binding-like beta-propeller repeat protein [Streptomyces]QWB23913.1 PQQ-binding-like beta-propeller repeat protein [Streptomyces koelreuteriae]UUA06895.1 serine/threonine-protein kinase [Streptomyces koelreuteriae]UUA14524.1 serine/threonine-protein kinase [Streptomyces sp. CRCS-T-1]
MAAQGHTGAGPEAELPEYAGHYRLEECLGSGGMGVVHLARSTSGMKLAVKVVHAQFAEDAEFRGRFRQEVAAARRVSGAFTAPVVDADPEAGRPWMATLFIPGSTLAQEVKRNGPLAPAQLRRLMAGLAEALRDIHRVGVVHRDLKPSNVLLAEDGPKVIDFGISRPKDSELRTETGKLIGTPPFMAPEQFRRPREVGPAADVFALGSVMVHAATGRGPFDSDSPYVVAYQVVHDEPDLAGVPEQLAPLVLRCLAKEPEDRPSPDELMRELRSVSASYDTQVFIPAQRGDEAPGAGEAVAATPSVVSPRRRFGARLGKRAVLGAGALGLAVAGGFAVVPLLGGGSAPAPAASAPRTTAAAFTAWEATPLSKAGGTPLCSYAAGKLLCAQSGLIFALDPDDGRLLWKYPLEGIAAEGPVSEAPVVSGDRVLAGLGHGQRLTLLDPDSGDVVRRQAMTMNGGVAAVGGMVLLTAADGTVTGVDSASGDVKWRQPISGQAVPYFTVFPGDPLAYAATVSDDGATTKVTAVDPGTGEVRWDARLEGALEPIGTEGGSVVFLSGDAVQGDARAVVRYSPEGRTSERVPLRIPLQGVQGSVRGDVVHLMADSGGLVAVDLKARKQLWSLQTGVARGSVPVAGDRYVYVTTPDGRLLAVDGRRGKLVGQTSPRLAEQSDRVPATLPTPVVVDDHVFAGAPDGSVFGVDGRDPAGW